MDVTSSRHFCRLLAGMLATVFLAAGGDQTLWSLKPVARPAPPVGGHSTIDAFISAALRARGLKPAPPAEKTVLLRRVYLDLIGLPPSPDELDAFLHDTAPDAYEKVVDRLLASEQFGVRYGRRWLDVLRYTDLDGHLPSAAGIHRWRDWVISALNRDLPYDQFVRAQIAGDLSERADDIFATGFLARGAHTVNDKEQEIAFGATETISSAFLGMTVGCARCHNHFFDPISQRDYYAMKSLFDGLVLEKRTLATGDQIFAHSAAVDRWHQERAAIEKPMNELIGPYKKRLLDERIAMLPPDVQKAIHTPESERTPDQRKLADDYAPVIRIDPPKIREVLSPEQQQQYDAFRKQLSAVKPPPELPVFWAVREDPRKLAEKSYILQTGDPEKRGEEVQPGFPFAPPNVDFTIGRRQAFLNWLTSPRNPLFARVAVNRVWLWHFGRGLVPTPNDFGVLGEKPSHPELFDWLASEFVERGWSLKALHKLIVLSETYRRASHDTAEAVTANRKIDPDNIYLSRFRLIRLEAEIVRDLVLSMAGTLDLSVGGMSFREGPPQYWLGSDKEMGEFDTRTRRRGAYMGRGYHQDRDMMPTFLQIFDAEDGRRVCGRRNETVTAPQALTMMNSPLLEDAANKFGGQLEETSKGDLELAVRLGYRQSVSREPTPKERDYALSYLAAGGGLEGFAWMLMNLDEFIYIR